MSTPKYLLMVLIILMQGCSVPIRKVEIGIGGLPGDIAISSPNGVTGYQCDNLLIEGKKFEFTLDAGSPTQTSYAEKMCSCLRAGKTQTDATNAFVQIKNHGVDSWGAKGALAILGAGIKKCQNSIE